PPEHSTLSLHDARPILLGILAADAAGPDELGRLDGDAGRTLESVAASLLVKLRGTDRQALVDLLDRRGAIESARKRTRGLGAVRSEEHTSELQSPDHLV